MITKPDISHLDIYTRRDAAAVMLKLNTLLNYYEQITGVPMELAPKSTQQKDDQVDDKPVRRTGRSG